ncbi:MAG TPA: hypothetical protein DCQ34_08880 [Chitinophagaceae bacterium]|nr:hypothetical protein [Chitinophagaceae bacterium]
MIVNMKTFLQIIILGSVLFYSSCRPTRQIKQVIAPREATEVLTKVNTVDSLAIIQATLDRIKANRIEFKTFSAKIKVEVTDNKGKQPDLSVVVRMIKDSAIWMSISATFLNIEVYRVLITPSQVILQDKQAKEVQYRTLEYLQEVTEIPFDFNTLQNLLIGNPVFFDDNISSYRQFDQYSLVTAVGEYFKNLLTLSNDRLLLMRCKLDDVDISRNRTADITYADYVQQGSIPFSTNRRILISEKNKIDVQMNFKQFEFNKDLSVSFNVPKNYKRK